MIGLKTLSNDEAAGSFSNRMRARRFRLFESLASKLPRPLRIIDIGGTNSFWERMGWAGNADVQITTVNIHPEPQKHDNIIPRVGDATDLGDIADASFDIAFSNSVIEHLFTLDNQAAMAREVMRIGRAFWVQTPNFWFPIEPHFHFFGWQWLPISVRIAIIRRRTCGWRGKTEEPEKARQIVSEVRLMSRRELRRIFPNAAIIPEKFAFLNKSWIVTGGFPD